MIDTLQLPNELHDKVLAFLLWSVCLFLGTWSPVWPCPGPCLKLFYKIGSVWSEILMRTDWTITIGLHEVSQVQHGDTFSCYPLFSFPYNSSKFSPRKGYGRGTCIPVMLLRTGPLPLYPLNQNFLGNGKSRHDSKIPNANNSYTVCSSWTALHYKSLYIHPWIFET